MPVHDRSLEATWRLCLVLAALRRRNALPSRDAFFRIVSAPGVAPQIVQAAPDDPRARLRWHCPVGWTAAGAWPAAAGDLLDLYLPVLNGYEQPSSSFERGPAVPRAAGTGARRIVVGHLGQSIDSRIATHSGDSCPVSGSHNLTHLHRMRALCDAVLVGASTVAADDPRLTTRRVAGNHPARVVLDPRARLPGDRRVFNDGAAPTLLVCDDQYRAQAATRFGAERVLGVAAHDGACGSLDLHALLDALSGRGLNAIFVEGGGVTVSRFLQQQRLDRLQIAVAPVIVGSGRDALGLQGVASMRDCLRPSARLFRMGEDVLWDFDLHAARSDVTAPETEPTQADGLAWAPVRLR